MINSENTRPPVLGYGQLTTEQRRIWNLISGGARAHVPAPLKVWLSNPGLAEPAQALGIYCRYGTSLPPHLSELAILVVAAYWRAGFEWHVHAPIAVEAGVPADAIEAIRNRTTPQLPSEGAAVYEFARNLMERHDVSDEVYHRLVRAIGPTGAIDLVGLLGYYGLISMTIKAFRIPIPAGEAEPFAADERSNEP